MTAITRFAPGISAAALALSLALGLALNLAVTSAVFAGDPMSRDVDFRNSLSGQGGSRDTGTRETIVRDSRKKEDALKSYGSAK